MLQIKEIVNSIFTSKTYILFCEEERKAWLVDIGDVEPVINFCNDKGLTIEGVLLTHVHFDHIYGLNNLIHFFPSCRVYTNDFGKKALASDKLNMSKYHEKPFVYNGENVVLVQDREKIKLFDSEPLLQFYETPGHNPSCLTMEFGAYLFTGDAYIPGIATNTQLPYADKEQARQSLIRILRLGERKIIYSGHKLH